MTYATVLNTEEGWYTADLSGQSVPALTKAQGGPYDLVAAQVRRVSQHPHQLFLGHGPTRDRSISKAGDRRIDHDIVALIFWPAAGAGGRAHLDQEALDDAVERVLARVRGPVGDRTHGGRWWSVGEARVEPPNPSTLLAFRDAVTAAGMAYEASIRYQVTEMVWA